MTNLVLGEYAHHVTHKAATPIGDVMNCCPPPEGWLQEAVRVASFGGGGLAFATGS